MLTEVKIFAITFVLFISLTVIVPTFPPAQLLYEYLSIEPTLSIRQIYIAVLLKGLTNGSFWTIITLTANSLVQLALLKRRRQRPLPPMPVAPPLTTLPLKNKSVDSRANRIAPDLTIQSDTQLFARRNGPALDIITTEPVSIRPFIKPIRAEQDIETIQGIDPLCGELLRLFGINTVGDLLKAGATEHERHRLADEVLVNDATILRWIHNARAVLV
jgi:hypothetical protein